MISRSPTRRCDDAQLDMLVGEALRTRVAGAGPSERVWEQVVARARRVHRIEWSLLHRALARCLEAVDRALPLMEVDRPHGSRPRPARSNAHWQPLNIHYVTVHLLC